MWASTPAVLWTAERPQERGIHVHVYEDGQYVVDDTFGANGTSHLHVVLELRQRILSVGKLAQDVADEPREADRDRELSAE